LISAELQGKISSKLKKMEDLLTSNVFSFFKYSDRSLLKGYLHKLGLSVSSAEANTAIFEFWPRYVDNTEPDLVIVCGRYYILFEAKLYSDFSPETLTLASQIDREVKMGKAEAESRNREFVYIAITAEYFLNKKKYSKFINQKYFHWTNWSAVTKYLFEIIETNTRYKSNLYVEDLYALLVKKRLRSFVGLNDIYRSGNVNVPNVLFYDSNTSVYKGEYSGYHKILASHPPIETYKKFFNRKIFDFSEDLKLTNEKKVFYEKTSHHN
jgi:hypothetical protein